MFEIRLETSVQEIAHAMQAQNDAILNAFLNPQPIVFREGYGEDPHGQTIYQHADGSVDHISDHYNRNGWTG